MPKKALRLTTGLNIETVTCPGTYLRDRGDIYLSVCLFGYQKATLSLPPIFPLIFHQQLAFERTFVNCTDPVQLSDRLEQEHVVVELVQQSYKGEKVLAYYETSAKDLLYPDPILGPSYSMYEREILLERTFEFKGISPKLEFNCSTTVQDSKTPILDEWRDIKRESNSYEDIITITPTNRQSRSRKRTKSYEHSTHSSRAKSPKKYQKGSSLVQRPPFIVKQIDTHNRAVSPAGKIRPTSAPPIIRAKSLSPTRTRTYSFISENDCAICQLYKRYLGRRYWGHSYNYHPNHGIDYAPIREILEPRTLYSETATEVSDDTEDILSGINGLDMSSVSEPPVAGLDVEYARLPSPDIEYATLPLSPRPRPSSPALTRRSLRQRYGEYPLSPSTSDRIHRKITSVLDQTDPLNYSEREELDTLRSSSLYSTGRRSNRTSDRRYNIY